MPRAFSLGLTITAVAARSLTMNESPMSITVSVFGAVTNVDSIMLPSAIVFAVEPSQMYVFAAMAGVDASARIIIADFIFCLISLFAFDGLNLLLMDIYVNTPY